MSYVKIEAVVAWSALLLLVGISSASPPEASVAVSHRQTQARTDAQPKLPDDLAGQRRNDSGNSGQSGGEPGTSDIAPDIGRIIGDAVQAAKPVPPEIVVHIADFPCAPCERLKATLDSMGERVNVTYKLAGESQYPALKYAGHTWYGALSAGQIDAIIRDYSLKPVPQAVSVGRLQIRSAVSAILDRVDAGGNIRIGSATITLPETMQPQVKLAGDRLQVTFAGVKPQFKYGSGWLAVGAPINGFTLTESLLTVSIAGLPDVSLEVSQ